MGFPGDSDGKESTCNVGDLGSIPGFGKVSWRRAWQPTPEFLTGKSHGQRILAGYSSCSCKRVGHDFAIKQQHSVEGSCEKAI